MDSIITRSIRKKKLSVTIKPDENSGLLPVDKKAISNFHTFDIKTGLGGFLTEPVLLSLSFNSQSKNSKSIYYFDNMKDSWKKLSSRILPNSNIIQAKTIFPYAKIAVLEEKLLDYKTSSCLAPSKVVFDKQTGELVYAENHNQVRPIASLTKLMTALVFLDSEPDWNKIIKINDADNVGGAEIVCTERDSFRTQDLFRAMLVGSKNNIAMALVRSSGFSIEEFVLKMNQKAVKYNLNNTRFVDPTGLSEQNISSAGEVAVIAREAFNRLEMLQSTTLKGYSFSPTNRTYKYNFVSTSKPILDTDLYITGTKTGFTKEAGYCLVTQARKEDKELIGLVLGVGKGERYREVYNLLSNSF